jgi:hypothetical protein
MILLFLGKSVITKKKIRERLRKKNREIMSIQGHLSAGSEFETIEMTIAACNA